MATRKTAQTEEPRNVENPEVKPFEPETEDANVPTEKRETFYLHVSTTLNGALLGLPVKVKFYVAPSKIVETAAEHFEGVVNALLTKESIATDADAYTADVSDDGTMLHLAMGKVAQRHMLVLKPESSCGVCGTPLDWGDKKLEGCPGCNTRVRKVETTTKLQSILGKLNG